MSELANDDHKNDDHKAAGKQVVIACDCGAEFYVPDALVPAQERQVGHVTCPDCLAKYDFHLDGGSVVYSYHDFEDEE